MSKQFILAQKITLVFAGKQFFRVPTGDQSRFNQMLRQVAGFDGSAIRLLFERRQLLLQLLFGNETAAFEKFEKALGTRFGHE